MSIAEDQRRSGQRSMTMNRLYALGLATATSVLNGLCMNVHSDFRFVFVICS